MSEIKVINLYKDRFVYIDKIDDIMSDDIDNLNHYPSQKPQRKLIELFHCYNNTGGISLFDAGGSFPIFKEKRMSTAIYFIRKCSHLPSVFIDAETFEFVDVKE